MSATVEKGCDSDRTHVRFRCHGDAFALRSVGNGDLADSLCRLERPSSGKENLMAAVCEVCGKGPSWGMSVSHSHRRTKRRWNPNIQRVRALVGSTPKRMYVCTGCIKSGK